MSDDYDLMKRVDEAIWREGGGGPVEPSKIVCQRKDDPGFSDDLFAVCSECSVGVRYRPYMPPLPKICLDCVGLRQDEGEVR